MADEKRTMEEYSIRYYTDVFRKADPMEISLRTNVPYDPERRVFSFTLMNSVYEISHPEFSVHYLSGAGDHVTNYPAAHVLILRYLVRGQFIRSGGTFRSYGEMPRGDVYLYNFTRRCINRLAFTFAGKGDDMVRKMSYFKGIPYEKGDFGWEFEFMPGLSIRFAVWNADEEFPPSAQILFSDNFQYAFDADDMAYSGDIFIKIISSV